MQFSNSVVTWTSSCTFHSARKALRDGKYHHECSQHYGFSTRRGNCNSRAKNTHGAAGGVDQKVMGDSIREGEKIELNSWPNFIEIHAQPIDTGEKILYTYLERFPHNQQRFAAFKNTPIIMLKGTPGFRSHANKIMWVKRRLHDTRFSH